MLRKGRRWPCFVGGRPRPPARGGREKSGAGARGARGPGRAAARGFRGPAAETRRKGADRGPGFARPRRRASGAPSAGRRAAQCCGAARPSEGRPRPRPFRARVGSDTGRGASDKTLRPAASQAAGPKKAASTASARAHGAPAARARARGRPPPAACARGAFVRAHQSRNCRAPVGRPGRARPRRRAAGPGCAGMLAKTSGAVRKQEGGCADRYLGGFDWRGAAPAPRARARRRARARGHAGPVDAGRCRRAAALPPPSARKAVRRALPGRGAEGRPGAAIRRARIGAPWARCRRAPTACCRRPSLSPGRPECCEDAMDGSVGGGRPAWPGLPALKLFG